MNRTIMDKQITAQDVPEAYKASWNGIAGLVKSVNVRGAIISVAQEDSNGRINVVHALLGKPSLLATMLRELEETQCYQEQEQADALAQAVRADADRTAALLDMESEANEIVEEQARLGSQLENLRQRARTIIHAY